MEVLEERALDPCGSGQDPMAGFCENGNDHLSLIYGVEFLELLRDYQRFTKNPAQLN
jgi:hypothetical protein